jgi:hypothetical protein
MEGTIVEERGSEVVSASLTGTESIGPSDNEEKLAKEIRDLWTAHEGAQAAATKTKAEIKEVRERLSERLCQMKQLLAKPGRRGGWSSFLRVEGFAKATADRLVRKHQAPSGPQPNVVSEEVSEPTEADVERFFESLVPRLEQRLATARAAYRFLLRFVCHFELGHGMQDTGILVLEPIGEESPTPVETLSAEQPVAVADANNGDAN